MKMNMVPASTIPRRAFGVNRLFCALSNFRFRPPSRDRKAGGLLTLLSFAAVLGGLPAVADIAWDRGSVTLKTELLSQYDSNIFSNRSETADWHSVLTPSANFVRDAGLIRLSANGGVSLQHFQDNSTEDSTDPFVYATANLVPQEDSKIDGSFETFLRRRSDANVDVNTRARVEEFDVKASFKHFPFEKIGYRISGDIFDQNFLLRGMSDIRTKSLDGEGRYHFSPKADVFAGIGGRWSSNYHLAPGSAPMDSEDVKFKVGLDGEILPKVSGRVAAGYVHRRFRTMQGGTQSGALYDTALQWRPDNEMTVTLRANRDFDTTPLDQSVMRFVAGLEAWREVREKVRIMAGISYSESKYIGVGVLRLDETYAGTAGMMYSFTNRFKGGANLSYATTKSNFAFADYGRFIGGISLALTF